MDLEDCVFSSWRSHTLFYTVASSMFYLFIVRYREVIDAEDGERAEILHLELEYTVHTYSLGLIVPCILILQEKIFFANWIGIAFWTRL